ncbi:putative transcription factor Lambda-DB family [Helianthus debilis subsp. tardiflorus]
MSGHIAQDWEPVVIRKKAPTAAARKDEKAVNAARRAGAEIETVRKAAAGSNKAASSSTSLNTRKLDEETENLTHEKVPTELKKAIIQGRTEKKLTQAQLAQLINEKPQIIQEYESGKAIPNQQIITKLERALGVKLRESFVSFGLTPTFMDMIMVSSYCEFYAWLFNTVAELEEKVRGIPKFLLKPVSDYLRAYKGPCAASKKNP